MAKRVDPLKAKQAKQKKIAAAGAVLLLGLVAVQGPKTLKMLQGPQPVASATSTAPTTTTAAPTPTPTGETPVAVAADLASVADSDAAPVAEEGQLATFERFASKDPFVQQGGPAKVTPRVSNPNVGKGSSASGGAPGADTKPADAEGGSTDGAAGGFTTGSSAPDQPAVATATVVAVNGVEEEVAAEGAFPEDEPTFVLVAVAENGKSVEIGIAGGAYASGGETMTLKLGETITLQNTADGSRYELELRAVQGFPVPKQKS